MLSDQEIDRIKREVEMYKGLDVSSYINEMMPWMKPIHYTVKRASQILEELTSYALISDYAVNLYGIPYWSKKIEFAVKNIELERFTDILNKSGFRKLTGSDDCLTLIDLQMNNLLAICKEPYPLRWDDEMVNRIIEAPTNVKVLSPEDYIVFLIKRGGLIEMDLAAKIVYLRFDTLNKEYLLRRARNYNVEREISNLLERIR